jgi:hypothetical protein
VLDLTDVGTREALAISLQQLVAGDLTRCRAVAARAREAGYDGILAPSAALAGEQTLVVFASAMRKLSEGHSRIGRPPERARRVLRRVRRAPRA